LRGRRSFARRTGGSVLNELPYFFREPPKIAEGAANILLCGRVPPSVRLWERIPMFAKPNWFRAKAYAHGVAPASWQGWLYLAAVAAAVFLPTLVLIGRHQGLEALIWMAAIGALVGYDLWNVRRALTCPVATAVDDGRAPGFASTAAAPTRPDDGIYFLDRAGSQPVNTTRFQLSLKQ
jgi:hypothetical protein